MTGQSISEARPNVNGESETELFLRLLGQGTKSFTFQTFDDVVIGGKARGDSELAWQPTDTLENIRPRLDALQGRGAGVFVTVQETDGKGRTKANIIRIRAVFAELDNGCPEKWPLPPSMIVESSPGKYHVYWLVSDWPRGDEGLEAFHGVMTQLVTAYGSDHRATDVARVLRVPGFIHQKNLDKPFVTRLVEAPGHVYTHQQIICAFPPIAPKRRKARAEINPCELALTSLADWNGIVNALSCIPADDYDIWLKVGMALKHEAGDTDVSFAVWDAWSATAKNYDKRVIGYKWSSFDARAYDGKPVTLGTLHHLAREAEAESAGNPTFAEWKRRCFDQISAALPPLKAPTSQGTMRQVAGIAAKSGARLPSQTDERKAHATEQVKQECAKSQLISWPVAKGGNPIGRSQENIEAFIQHLGVTLYKDIFAGRYMIEGLEDFSELNDEALRELHMRADRLGLRVPKDYFFDAVLVLARKNQKHPAREYFDSLEWDGTKRLDNWLHTYCGADSNDLNSAFGRKWLIAAVRRIRNPGTKFDQMLVLIGPQGTGKSTVARILAVEQQWYEDSLSLGSEPKVVIEQTRGKLIAEISELRGSTRETEAIKAMLSRTHDTARPAYGRTSETVPRQFVMIGTTNSHEFLNDPTGNRRYWPIEVDVGPDRLEALKKQVDQLWAEAAVAEAKGETLELPPKLWPAAAAAQRAREIEDPIYLALRDALAGC